MMYALSGGHKKTIEAAELILQQGGNAVDAAIAAYLVSYISEPCMASIGAGGFAMINDNSRVAVVDFFCQTPIHKKHVNNQEFYPITVDFGSTKEDFHIGKGSVAVPGAIAGIYKMHELYGSIPIKELIEPAKIWAKQGIALDKFQAFDFTLLKDIFAVNQENKHLFFNQDNTLKKEGDVIKMEAYSDFLDALSYEGRDLFYKGEISNIVSKDMDSSGHLTRQDFEQYEAIVRKPIQFDFVGTKVNTTGFPSVGGMLLTAILNTFQDRVASNILYPNTIEHFQELIHTFSQVSALNNDQSAISNYLQHNFAIHTKAPITQGAKKWSGTSHFNVTDKNGMTVSLTTSIGEGSGYFIPGTNMQMNNMLGEEALMPNGFHNWPTNQRLQSMMCPTMITSANGSTVQAMGSGGAGRIPYAISQSIINSEFFKLPTPQAISAPRVYINDGKIEMERGFDVDLTVLPNINSWDTPSLYFGGVNVVSKLNNTFRGYADQRRFGSVINVG